MFELTLQDTRPASEEGRWLEVKDLAGAPTGARILLKGPDSRAYQDIRLEQRRARLEHMRKVGDAFLDPALVDAEDIDALVAVTAGWEGFGMCGAEWPFSAERARELYTGWPHVKAQAQLFLAERGNFLPRSASGS